MPYMFQIIQRCPLNCSARPRNGDRHVPEFMIGIARIMHPATILYHSLTNHFDQVGRFKLFEMPM